MSEPSQTWWQPSADLGAELPPLEIRFFPKYIGIRCVGGFKGTIVPGINDQKGGYVLVISRQGRAFFRAACFAPPVDLTDEKAVSEWLICYPIRVTGALIWSTLRAERIARQIPFNGGPLGFRLYQHFQYEGAEIPRYLSWVPARFREYLWGKPYKSWRTRLSEAVLNLADLLSVRP